MGRTIWMGALVGFLIVGCTSAQVAAQGGGSGVERHGPSRGPSPSDGWIGGAPLHTRVVVGDDGSTYVGVWVEAPDAPPSVTERAPMAVSLVIDTSGSMSGQKIQNARLAAASLLENLQDGDLVSIYGFSNDVTQIAPPTRVDAASRPTLMARVNDLYASGGTNMYAGLRAGISRMAQVSADHPVRRLVLISDGHANIGPSDATSLGDLAAQGSEWGMQVTAIGVGLDYDENTLGALAVRSAGRLYHLSNPSQMAAILEEELHLLAQTVATDAYVEIVPAPGVHIVGSATPGAQVRGNRVRVKLGSVHAGQSREVLLRAKLDSSAPGTHALATARLVFSKPRGGAPVVQQKALRYEVTRDRSSAARSKSPRVAAMVATQEAAEAQFRAARLLNQGQGSAAASELARAQQRLRSAAAAAPAPVRRQLMDQARKAGGAARRAAGVHSASEGRGAALEVNSMAMDAEGY